MRAIIYKGIPKDFPTISKCKELIWKWTGFGVLFLFCHWDDGRKRAILSPRLKESSRKKDGTSWLFAQGLSSTVGGRDADLRQPIQANKYPQARPLRVRKGIWDPDGPKCHLWTAARDFSFKSSYMQSFLCLFFLFSIPSPHYSDAYKQNSTDGACFYELSPEIWFEISPVSSVILSLQQMHLNVSNLFAACATTRAKEGIKRLAIPGEAKQPAPCSDPRSQLQQERKEGLVSKGTASKLHTNPFCLPLQLKSVLWIRH